MRFKRWPRAVSTAVLLAASATSWAQVHAKNEAAIHEGLRIFYNRDRGQITGIDIQLPGQKQQRQPFMTDIKWFPFGPPKSWRWANGAEVRRTFDLSARMTSTEFATYRYDAAGRMTGITQSLWAKGPGKQPHVVPVTWEVTYDSRNRITGFSREGASSQYTYDANSNRLSAVETVSGGLDLDGAFDGADVFQSTEQSVQMDPASNRMLGFTRTVTRVEGGQTRSVVTTPVAYTLDANGNITSDGLRVFEYDSARNLAKVRVSKSQEAASVRYLVNALGQRVFKSEPMAEDATPGDGTDLEKGFAAWLRQRLGWLFKPSRTEGMLGTIYNYGDGPIPVWALMGEYDTGTALGKGVTEYIWMPLEDGSAIPVGMVRNGDVFAIHTDHLGTPRLVTDEKAKAVWQWPYSAFGANQPIGMLQPAGKQNKGNTGEPPGYKATQAEEELNLRFPGQYWDEESQLVYNFNRSYRPDSGRYGQADPIGLGGGLNRYLYARANALGFIDPEGLMEVFVSENKVTFRANPGTPAGGTEHARKGPGEAYHMHIRDREGREVRMSTETWKPLTPEDERIYKSSPQIQKACDSLTDGQKKFFDRVTRQVFHRGVPTDRQLMRLLQMRTGGRGGGRGSE